MITLSETDLVKAVAERQIIELRIKRNGQTAALLSQLEEAEGKVSTIREILDSLGVDRTLRDEQIEQEAIKLTVAKTGYSPAEIARFLAKEDIERVEYDEYTLRVNAPPSKKITTNRWRKFVEDFTFACRDAFDIVYRPGLNPDYPNGGYGPLILNEHQRKIAAKMIDLWLDGKPVRIIILKARQLGITTTMLAFFTWLVLQKDNFVVFFMIDKDPHMYEKRDMILRWLENAADLYEEAPTISAKGGKRIVLSNGSKFLFESAMSPNPGTSEMIDVVYMTEKPKWPKGRAALVDKSLLPGIPSAKDTFIIDESTAQGMENFYYKWKRVTNGEEVGRDKTIPIFLPWYLSTEYKEVPPPSCYDEKGNFIYLDDDPEVCETDEYGEIILTESEYAEKFGLTEDQIYWRRVRIKNTYNGVRADFDQEYPTTPEHAWASVGRLFFGSDVSRKAKKTLKEPLIVGNAICRNGLNDTTRLYSWTRYNPGIKPGRGGNVKIYKLPEKGHKYYLGGDVAEGKVVELGNKYDPDYSVAVVIDENGELCSIMRARVKPEDFAWHCLMLALMYNNAMVNVERNAVGEAVWVMFKQTGYLNVYTRNAKIPFEDRAWSKMNSSTRKSALIEMRYHLRKHPEHIVDADFADEVGNFIVNTDGKPEAVQGSHDDIVFAYMHAYTMVYDRVGVHVPIVDEDEEETDVREWNCFDLVLEENNIHIEW